MISDRGSKSLIPTTFPQKPKETFDIVVVDWLDRCSIGYSWLHNTSILIPMCPHLQCYQPLIQSRSRSASGDKSTAMGLTGPHNLAKVSVHLEKGKKGKKENYPSMASRIIRLCRFGSPDVPMHLYRFPSCTITEQRK